MSTDELEVEVKGEGEEEGGEEKRHRATSEWERGYRIGYNKGRAFVWHQLGVRPSEIKEGKVKVIVGNNEREVKVDESSENDTVKENESTNKKKEEGGNIPLIVGIVLAAVLGIVVFHFVFGERNKQVD